MVVRLVLLVATSGMDVGPTRRTRVVLAIWLEDKQTTMVSVRKTTKNVMRRVLLNPRKSSFFYASHKKLFFC
jgi:hypothetical protein